MAELSAWFPPTPVALESPEAIREISEWIRSNGDLKLAVRARAAAYGPAYERYLRFKDVVRQTYGSSSAHYRRIHVRNSGRLAVDDPSPEPTDPERP